jgi:hypothetical protein
MASTSIRDFTLLKAFKVRLNPPKITFLKEVIWQPPPPHWIKCNVGGAYSSTASACGGLFKNCATHNSFMVLLQGLMFLLHLVQSYVAL